MAECPKCGNPVAEDQQVCPKCGEQIGGTGPPEPTAPAPRLLPGWTYTPGPPGAMEAATSRPARRGSRRLWIGSGAAAVAVVVACILVFVVFRGDIFTNEAGTATTNVAAATSTSTLGGTGGATPEEAVRRMFEAVEAKDVDALVALIDPVVLKNLLGGLSVEDAKQALAASVFGYGSIAFSGLEFSTVKTSETTATVTVTAGTATVTDSYGKTTTEGLEAAGQPVKLTLVQRDGLWYVDLSAFLSARP